MRHEVKGNDANRDPITGAPGSHPVGTGAGSAAAGATGAAVGLAVGGPVGALVGGVVGAIAGGAAGHSIAESIDPTVEDSYWRDNYSQRPYATKDHTYEQYRPAYQYGWESRDRYEGRRWDEIETEMERGWNKNHGTGPLKWDEARHATRDAWDHVTPENRFR